MIYGKLIRIGRYRGLGAHLDTAIRFLERQDLSALPPGKTEIDGENVFINRFDYTTGPQDGLEGHFRYIDIHIVLEGEEKIGVADVTALAETDRKENEDFLRLAGSFGGVCLLRPGDFLLVFPEDAHCPGLPVEGSGRVQKAVVKVLET